MLDFLNSILGFFESIALFIKSLVEGLIFLVTSIPSATTFMADVFAYVPAVLLPFVTVCVSISIIFLIAGR